MICSVGVRKYAGAYAAAVVKSGGFWPAIFGSCFRVVARAISAIVPAVPRTESGCDGNLRVMLSTVKGRTSMTMAVHSIPLLVQETSSLKDTGKVEGEPEFEGRKINVLLFEFGILCILDDSGPPEAAAANLNFGR